MWDALAGRERAAWKAPLHPVLCLRFSPDGRTLAAGGGEIDHGGELNLWDVETGQVRRQLEKPEPSRWAIRGLTFLAGGEGLARVSGEGWALPGESALWDTGTGRKQ